MFKRMQEKWGVSVRQFWIIFIAFGLTGTTTAIITRYITGWLGFDEYTHWGWKVLLRVAMLLFGYQILLLAYGALLGQWAFFWKYEKKLLQKLGILKKSTKYGVRSTNEQETGNSEQRPGNDKKSRLFIHHDFEQPQTVTARNEAADHRPQTIKTNIAIFASGAGSNAGKIIEHFKHHSSIIVSLVVCNKPGAGVLSIAEANGIPYVIIEKEQFFRGDAYLPVLAEHHIDFIVLAGFLWKIPAALIAAYPKKMINIHPALLPKYGGKGMYGMKVHESVLAAGEKESGITIHYVNEHFDEGEPIFQASCGIESHDTSETLAQKIHALEHAHFPSVIEKLIVNTSV
jgi:formyltetrahydrofolate-dependent phosphoribosylglycinamide formyltransferase